jgi:hypothetical protein
MGHYTVHADHDGSWVQVPFEHLSSIIEDLPAGDHRCDDKSGWLDLNAPNVERFIIEKMATFEVAKMFLRCPVRDLLPLHPRAPQYGLLGLTVVLQDRSLGEIMSIGDMPVEQGGMCRAMVIHRVWDGKEPYMHVPLAQAGRYVREVKNPFTVDQRQAARVDLHGEIGGNVISIFSHRKAAGV